MQRSRRWAPCYRKQCYCPKCRWPQRCPPRRNPSRRTSRCSADRWGSPCRSHNWIAGAGRYKHHHRDLCPHRPWSHRACRWALYTRSSTPSRAETRSARPRTRTGRWGSSRWTVPPRRAADSRDRPESPVYRPSACSGHTACCRGHIGTPDSSPGRPCRSRCACRVDKRGPAWSDTQLKYCRSAGK